jgi:glycosyltransferase involved in cell wall biosynthesis
MRICSPHVGISPYSNQGGEVYEREVLKHLAFLGAEIEIILPKGKDYEKGIPNWRVTEIPVSRGYTWYGSAFLFYTPLLRIWKERGFDILRIHSLRNVGTAAWIFRALNGTRIPLVSHHHHIDDDEGIIQMIDRFVLNHSDMVITVSRFSREQLVSRVGIDPEKVDYVHDGIEEKYVPLPPDEHLLDKYGLKDKKVLLFLSALHPRKNAGFLLDVFCEIARLKGDEVRLMIVGGGRELNGLKQKAGNLGVIDKVIFTGYIPEEDKVKYYNLADCFVFPSKLEGFGLVAGEAMSCGKPVVASRTASLPEVVDDGVTGFLAGLDNKDDFLRKILLLLDDEGLKRRMGAAARKKVDECFRWPIAARKILSIYGGLINAQTVNPAS